MRIWLGYARVSIREQNLSLQIDTLKKAGCGKNIRRKHQEQMLKKEFGKFIGQLSGGDILASVAIVYQKEIPVSQICSKLGINRSTFYQYLKHEEEECVGFKKDKP